MRFERVQAVALESPLVIVAVSRSVEALHHGSTRSRSSGFGLRGGFVAEFFHDNLSLVYGPFACNRVKYES